ncbi:MAG: hypothetical protein ACXADY_17800 [Candidatus Hodarchaeales archaeon]|jgi:hypothetical protein
MESFDDCAYIEYFNNVYLEIMKETENKSKGYLGRERLFQRHKLRLDYFAKFLADYQYFDETVKRKPFIEVFKDTFIFLSEWERQYTKELKENSEQSLDFRGRRNSFRNLRKWPVSIIIDTYFMFNCDGIYEHQSQYKYNMEALNVLKIFSKDYSLLLIDLIKFDLQCMISNSLRELLNNTKLLDKLQALCAKEWYVLSQKIRADDSLSPSPILNIYLESKARNARKPLNPSQTLQEFFSYVIDLKKLIPKSPELTHMVKAEELLSITEVIKELLTELRADDEIVEDDALAIIEENRPLEYLSQNELGEYLRQLLIDLPDFEYVRLKKSFRRKSSQKTELLTNIDSIFIQSIPSSLHNIEESLLEIQQSQSELLEQTQQLQELLESQFDLVIENQVKIEEYLFEKLGSEFEKIKHLWVMYKEKQLTGKEFVRKATKILGVKFSRIFVGILFFLK